jgi:hypothetical protein
MFRRDARRISEGLVALNQHHLVAIGVFCEGDDGGADASPGLLRPLFLISLRAVALYRPLLDRFARPLCTKCTSIGQMRKVSLWQLSP